LSCIGGVGVVTYPEHRTSPYFLKKTNATLKHKGLDWKRCPKSHELKTPTQKHYGYAPALGFNAYFDMVPIF